MFDINKTVDGNMTLKSMYTQIGNDWLMAGLFAGLLLLVNGGVKFGRIS